MPSTHCQSHAGHEQSIAAHEKRLNAQSRKLNEAAEERKQMTVMMQRLIDLSEYAQRRIDQHAADLKHHEDRIHALEEKPAADAQKVKNAALGSIGGAIGTGIIACFALAISKTIS